MMSEVLRYAMLAVSLMLINSINPALLSAQHTEHFAPYVALNYPQMGHRSTIHWSVAQELRNLKGPVKRLIQDAYDHRDIWIPFDGKNRTESYAYLFNEDKSISQAWMFLDNNVPAFKEIYYNFKESRPQYHIKFYARLKMEYSITYQYNNQHIPTGRKTTAGPDLTTERYQFDLLKDTTTVYANDFNKEYIANRLSGTYRKSDQTFESLTYHKNGLIHECLIYHKDVLSEAFEYDTLGRILEHQIYKSKPVYNKKTQSNSPLGFGKLVLYSYNEDDLLQSERHRYIDTILAPYRIEYAYDAEKRLAKQSAIRGEDTVRTNYYSYNQQGDRVPLAKGPTSQDQIEYSDYDEHGNWKKKVVMINGVRRRYLRRIEYYEE